MSQWDDLRDKPVLVTGAFSGLGLHFTKTLAARGARVVMAGRRIELGTRLADQLRAEGLVVQAQVLDVTDPDSVQSAFVAALDWLGGPPEVIVNNAGVAHTKPALEVSPAEWSQVLAVNLSGAFFVAQAAARALIAAGKGGSIINVASILGLRVANQVPAYAVAKAGLIQLTKALALEWARHGIRVNALAPGYIATDLNRDFFASDAGQAVTRRVPQRRLGDASELDGALCLLASDASSYMTGSVLVLDGGHLVNSL